MGSIVPCEHSFNFFVSAVVMECPAAVAPVVDPGALVDEEWEGDVFRAFTSQGVFVHMLRYNVDGGLRVRQLLEGCVWQWVFSWGVFRCFFSGIFFV